MTSFRVLVMVCCVLLLVACSQPGRGSVPTFAPPATQVGGTGPALGSGSGGAPGTTVSAEYGQIVESVQARGRVVAKQETSLMFPLAGRLKAVPVAPGDRVAAGAVLAELDAPELGRELLDRRYEVTAAQIALSRAELAAQSQAALAQAQRELARTQYRRTISATQQIAEAQLEVARSTSRLAAAQAARERALADLELQRAQTLYNQDQTLERQLDLSRATLQQDQVATTTWREDNLADAQLDLAEAQYREQLNGLEAARAELQIALVSTAVMTATGQLDVALARAQLERAEALYQWTSQQLSGTLLLAPFDGQIVSLDKRAGDQVAAYEPIGVLADPSELWVVAMVLDDDVNQVTVGSAVTVTLDAYPDRAYAGRVLQVADQATTWQGRSAYEVTVAFAEAEEVPAVIRMGADVSIAGPVHENVLTLPERAILTIGGRTYVERVGEGGQVERVEVQTGASDGTRVEIVAGLQPGQTVRLP